MPCSSRSSRRCIIAPQAAAPLTALIAAAAVGVGLTIPAAARAQTLYTDSGAFSSATAGMPFTPFNFEGIAPDNSYTNLPDPYTQSGVKFTSYNGVGHTLLFVVGDDTYYPGTAVFSANSSDSSTGGVILYLPASTTAISLDYADAYDTTLNFTTSPGASYDVTPTSTSFPDNFVGFVSDTPITSLTITGPQTERINISSISYAGAPEPGSLALLVGAAGGGILVCRRRRHRRR